MAHFSSSIAVDQVILKPNGPSRRFYAVYDCCASQDSPSRDVAFIEERLYEDEIFDTSSSDEEYFHSLKDAKCYVSIHFASGAEYFSLQQSNDPDNFFYILTDKIRYLIA